MTTRRGDAISAALPNNRVATKHQRAPPHAEVGVARARVRASGAYLGTKLAFEFLVLTASRSGEIRQAQPMDGLDQRFPRRRSTATPRCGPSPASA